MVTVSAMARVLGVGGFFVKSADPQRLSRWYRDTLGMPVDDGTAATFMPESAPAGGITVWSAFPADTEYFGPGSQQAMANLIVDDLDAALQQLRAAGADVASDVQDEPYGRFCWFIDPDGNRVELWQPPEAPEQ